jgi:hypothetical protein
MGYDRFCKRYQQHVLIAWTARAVNVRVHMSIGATHVVWVWASAVDRLRR